MTKKELINSADYVVDKSVKIAGTNYDRRRKVTRSMRRRMIQMYEAGRSLTSISKHFGVSYDSVKRAVIPGYDTREKERKRKLNFENGYRPEYDPTRQNERANYKRQLLMENKKLTIS